MADNFFDKLNNENPEKVTKASEVIKQALGEDFNIKEMMKNSNMKNKFNLRLSEGDKKKIAALINNPELLKLILSNPKAKEGLKNFFKSE